MYQRGYKDLIVWQKSMQLTVAVYALTEQFPKTEVYGLVSQMRRCAVSIPSNIAEGSKRSSIKDNRNFLHISFGSGAELETQLELSKLLPFGKDLSYETVDALLGECMKMLQVMTRTPIQRSYVSSSIDYQLIPKD